jgi:hypothetical protein
MSDQYTDIDLRSDFVTAGYLHSNFYEDGMSSLKVEGAAEAAKRLIKKLENLSARRSLLISTESHNFLL